MNSKILFVSDGQNLLNELRDLLSKKQLNWELFFAISGQEALTALAQQDFDLIVSDTRIQDMDGAELLGIVKGKHPEVARVIWSGHSDSEQELVMKALHSAHRFLHKPCDVETLQETIASILSARQQEPNQIARQLVGRLSNLPSPKGIYQDLLTAAQNPSLHINQLVHIIDRDPAMTAMILHIANSAFFGLAHQVTTITQALNYLGLETLKSLALAAQIFSMAKQFSFHDYFSPALIQQHSLQVSQMARLLMRNHPDVTPLQEEQVAVAGLLHDIGMIVFALGIPEEFVKVLQQARRDGKDFSELEFAALGMTHTQVGACLMEVWGLPQTIIEAIKIHHQKPSIDLGSMHIGQLVQMAQGIVHSLEVDARELLSSDPTTAWLNDANVLPRYHAHAKVAIELFMKNTLCVLN